VDVLIGGRQSGKTHQLAAWATRQGGPPRLIVATGPVRRDWMLRHFGYLGLRGEHVVTPDMLDALPEDPGTSLAVDDVDELLPLLLGRPVPLAAMTATVLRPVRVGGVPSSPPSQLDYTGEWRAAR
jgi:hypothetical protein